MKLVFLFMLCSTYLFGVQLPGDSTLIINIKSELEQNKTDSLTAQASDYRDTLVVDKQSDKPHNSVRSKFTPKSKSNELYPAIGTLDKAFLVANDFCTTTLTKWDLFLQRMLTKISNKINKTDDQKSK